MAAGCGQSVSGEDFAVSGNNPECAGRNIRRTVKYLTGNRDKKSVK